MAFLPVDLVLLEQEFDSASETFHRVEAGATERLAAFGARRLQAELGRTNCGDIATRASTDDEDVVVVFCHDSSLLTFVASQTWTGCYTVQGVKIKRVGHGWHHGTFASL